MINIYCSDITELSFSLDSTQIKPRKLPLLVYDLYIYF